MANSMEHWNGCQLCVLDLETTGDDSSWHELIQIALLPLDSNILPRKDVLPFYIEVAPESPERMDPEAMEVNKLRLAEITLRGHDREKAKDLLIEWIKKLKLPCTKYGTPKRLLLLSHNVAFDKPFLMKWLGVDMFNEYFDSRVRDTMIVASYLNDRAGMHAEKVPFPKVNLAWMAKTFTIPHEHAHDALQDCLVTAGIYRKLLMQGLLG